MNLLADFSNSTFSVNQICQISNLLHMFCLENRNLLFSLAIVRRQIVVFPWNPRAKRERKRAKLIKYKAEHFNLLSITSWNNYKSLKLSKVFEAITGVSLNS